MLISQKRQLSAIRAIRHIAQRHCLAEAFLFSKMAVNFLGFRAYYQAETKSADLGTGQLMAF